VLLSYFYPVRIFFLHLVFLAVLSGSAQTALEDVVIQLDKGNYCKVYRSFDATMQKSLSKKQVKEVWENLVGSAGALKSVADVKTEDRDGGTKQTGILKFEKLAVKMILSQRADKKINGLFVTQLGYQPPRYALGLGTGKKRINFISDSLELPGELIIPIKCNNCPVVVLVHGSGPNDKDETVGSIKVFYDIAMGLASKGIATFRYDKRFAVYPELMSTQFDLYDETIHDAIAALQTIQQDTSLQFGKYVMLGHSLGAYSMPLIANTLEPSLDGAILLSANARRLEDLIDYQMRYLTGFDDLITDEEEQIIIENTARSRNIRNGDYTDSTSAENLLAYWPGTFWRGVSAYDPVATVQSNSVTPFFLLQGEKDYQITMEDFATWKTAVGDMPNVSMQSFPGLTHLFTPTDANRGSPQDYFVPSNVDEGVIEAIAAWVKEL
jgi:pimeloyl-ACP methyl ester carboxylesterase